MFVETITSWCQKFPQALVEVQFRLSQNSSKFPACLFLRSIFSSLFLSPAGLTFCHLPWVWLFITQSYIWIPSVDPFGALKAQCYIYIICKPLPVPLLLVLSSILMASRNTSKWLLCLWMMICWGFELIIVCWSIEFAMACPLNVFLQGPLVRWMAKSGLSSLMENILSPLLIKPSSLNPQLEIVK